ncbi:ubiquitin-protein ligase E3B isoform X2 [Octopus bimaculoides]|uniref:Ubiquitin-protein ligase E3B n=1 Tax=Octopus bimaculoides TaxID=37653 RepID=A0A0L8G078_OCTBM|nr:ubiquitin-protein ligase E3B isoform X2 [Octopus bimaculoides]|eukprot:XP_014785402.1 PREDICTED: ubiquitin-protein ligase E3B-like [Octopus bimaculoides]
MFNSIDHTKKNQFLEQTKAAREERAFERRRDNAAIKIQSLFRGHVCRVKLQTQVRQELDLLLQIPQTMDIEYNPKQRPVLELFSALKKFLFVFNIKEDKRRYEYVCRYLLLSVQSENTKTSYVAMSMQKQHVLSWIQQLKTVLWNCCVCLKYLKPENHRDNQAIVVHLRMLITFTCIGSWGIVKGKTGEALKPGLNQLCNNIMGFLNSKGFYSVIQVLLTRGLARSKPVFSNTSLTAVITIALRPLLASNFSENLMTMFLLHILSVPAVIYHINTHSQECMNTLVTHRIFKRCLDLLTNEQSTRIVFNSLEGNYALCLLANLVHLGYTEVEGLVENTLKFMNVMIYLLDSCKKYVQSKKSNLTLWHPVLGWFSQNTDQSLHEAMPYVVKQLQLLWSSKMIRLLFNELLEYVDANKQTQQQTNKSSASSPTKGLLKKALEKASSKNTCAKIKLGSHVARATCLPCDLYQQAINTLSQLRLDILGGLSYNKVLLPILWKFLCDLGPNCGLKVFLELFPQSPNTTLHPVFSLLSLFSESAGHLITTLDDIEMYEQQRMFSLDDYIKMSDFLNHFVFKVIWNSLIDFQVTGSCNVFSAARSLLMILYERDSRRSFTPKDHWLIRDVKPSTIISELEAGRKNAQFIMQKIPHIIPFSERVVLFRKYVMKEKDFLGLTESVCTSPQSTLITIHRSRIVEDGYRQLAQLPARNLKGVIRVKFVNEQGLDEAGIDQDGVFKEFLEETISRVFDPSLSLFKATSEQKLYPSSTSYIQEDHLALFDFLGRMLGKAVYEGIVVDVPFAPFFLTQILGHQQSSTYSSLDELPSLDPELAKSLSYLKHYEGDVSELDLTFSCDEDCMGRLETHELVPGGKVIGVTDENKIRYVHLMAHFRMYCQIKEQTAAFIRGFRSVVNHEWLNMFSAPELQKLISGDNRDIDIEDLRRHTQYYGGYHNNHRVINWLWDIVDHDFSAHERSLFLKFVTSCSKPPLLGFSTLDPAFSIRCVEVSDDQDTGDTVGSVLKGFFNIRKKDPIGRLPTSSTCFNLLKLPNYQKKSTLKEKLRYAIHSNTGFELS